MTAGISIFFGFGVSIVVSTVEARGSEVIVVGVSVDASVGVSIGVDSTIGFTGFCITDSVGC